MAVYGGYVLAVTLLFKLRVADFNEYRELQALQYPVQTIGKDLKACRKL